MESWPDIESIVARLRSAPLFPTVKSISVEGEKNVIVVGITEEISDETKAEITSAVGASNHTSREVSEWFGAIGGDNR